VGPLTPKIRTRARFLYSVPNRQVSSPEVIVLTNKQTPLKTSTSLSYATPVGNEDGANDNDVDRLGMKCGVLRVQ